MLAGLFVTSIMHCIVLSLLAICDECHTTSITCETDQNVRHMDLLFASRMSAAGLRADYSAAAAVAYAAYAAGAICRLIISAA